MNATKSFSDRGTAIETPTPAREGGCIASGAQRSFARLQHIYLVPTFSCQLKCQSCYAAKQANHFDGYLSWPSFLRVLDFFGPSLRSVALIGGEPTQWKFIREAILFLQNKGKAVTLFSNGLDYIGVHPNRIIVNGTTLSAGDMCSVVSRNLARYRQHSVDIRLRFNIGEDWSERDTEIALTIVRRFSASVSISARYPVPRTNTLGSIIFGFARAAMGSGACVRISRCAPRCIFTNGQYQYLAQQCGLKSTCPLPSASVVVLPDGWSIQPCVEIPSPFTLADLRKRSARALFRTSVEAIRANGANRCICCDHFEARQCGGGCLAYLA
jgi:hypothetical protein